MKKLSLITLLISCIVLPAWAGNGLIHVPSNDSVGITADRLEAALTDKGMKIFNRIDHAAGASKAGMALRDSQLIIFGNPKIGTKLMQCQQSLGLDLPLKVLIWDNGQGQTLLSFTDMAYLKAKHGATACDPLFVKINQVLTDLLKGAAAD
jgi:uncharacterized protein (DUF302 family)